MSGLRGFLVAGTSSGCGKTSVSLGLMAALAGRGLDVRPFKAGPDFIDPGHHAAALGRISHNLDGWMLSRRGVREIFARYASGGDVALVEGVMGLFDGASGRDDSGSTAQLAKWLGLPVVLVLDARSMARSIAALAAGFVRFDPDICFAGLVLNRVGSPAHEQLLREALEAVPEVPLLGCLRRDADLELPSRHLGLVSPEESGAGAACYARLGQWVEQGLSLDKLLRSLSGHDSAMPQDRPGAKTVVRLGVARDAAFSFCYVENLRLLEAAGAKLHFFSPLEDGGLPPDLDGLYLPGGYPELHAQRLAANETMRASVRAFCASGRPVYAECGGFLYLLSDLRDQQGRDWDMCGVYPGRARMRERFAALGYREVRTLVPTLLGPAGSVARGHEFHYSELEGAPGGQAVYAVSGRTGQAVDVSGFALGNVLGSYIHLHLGSNPALAEHLIRACAIGRS
ncbi:MAG: cobyrinate a,c-diamide synthase [Desulfovibrionaceae bacterium]